MELTVALVSIIVLVLEGFDLFKNSSIPSIFIACFMGFCYFMYKVTKNSDSTDDEPTSNADAEDEKPIKYKIIYKELPKDEEEQPKPKEKDYTDTKTDIKATIPYKNYAKPHEQNKKRLSWIALYLNDKIHKVSIMASLDIRSPSENKCLSEGHRRKFEQLIDAAGGYNPKNAFASIFLTEDKLGKHVDIPMEYMHVYIPNGTVDQAANKLLNNINQYFGCEPFYVFHDD
jgi:hypothetical protein